MLGGRLGRGAVQHQRAERLELPGREIAPHAPSTRPSALATAARVRQAFEFTAETSAIVERTRRQSGRFRKESSGDLNSGNRPIDVSYELTSGTIDGLRECGPLPGTIVYDSVFVERDGFDVTLVDTTTTIDKQDGDRYWTVCETNLDGSLRDEYLIASLGLDLFCDFPEL